MIVYATPADLRGWLPPDEPIPDDTEAQLRLASLTVAGACNRNVYTDTPGAAEVGPLRDATCAQVQAWIDAGLTAPAAGGITSAPVKSSSLLDAKIDRDTAVYAQAVQRAARECAPQARAILDSAGLLYRMSASSAGAPPAALLPWGVAAPGAYGSPAAVSVTLTPMEDGTVEETVRWP